MTESSFVEKKKFHYIISTWVKSDSKYNSDNEFIVVKFTGKHTVSSYMI